MGTKKRDPYRFFKIEVAEILENLNRGFLQLEKQPEKREIFDELFRQAHTLKGASRLVKLENISKIGHALEDLLGDGRDKNLKFSTEIIDLRFWNSSKY